MPKRNKTQKEIILQVVEQVKVEENVIFQCSIDIDSAQKCHYFQKRTFVAGNFKRHLLHHHPGVFKQLGLDGVNDEPEHKKQRAIKVKLSVDMDRKDGFLGLLQFVTCNNLPFSFIEWSGSSTLLHPLLKACGAPMSRQRIAEYVTSAAVTIREIMRSQFGKQMVSIKIDSASRRGRSVFGINAQYIDADGNIQIRHLAVHEMHERQTKENLANVILQEIKEFGLEIDQIYAIAHDNGANMCASVQLLKSMAVPTCDDEEPLSTMLQAEFKMLEQYAGNDELEAPPRFQESDEEDESNSGTITEEPDDFENGEIGTPEIVINDEDIEELEILNSIRCGAHTAQLVAFDVIKLYKSRLAQINKICLSMHHKTNRELFILHKIALPPKVNETRWNVWFILLRYLQELRTKPFLATLQSQDPSLDLNKHWKFIDRFCEAFEPVYILTLKLQKNHVPLSEFYANWLICQAELNVIKQQQENSLAAKLLVSMERRIHKLKASDNFKACLLLDPRFNFAGSRRMSDNDKRDAQQFLIALHGRLDKLAGTREESVETNTANNSGFVEDYLMEFFDEGNPDDSASTSKNRSTVDSLMYELLKLDNREKVNITAGRSINTSGNQFTEEQSAPFDIIEYWKKRKFSNPILYRLAMVVLAAPATQITVERLFSQVKFVLTDSRMRLSGTSIKDIMVLKMNKDLLENVVEVILEREDMNL